MQLPSATSSYRTRVRFGRYVARRLRRDKFTQLADDAIKTTTNVREAGRCWDDADDGIQDALADRDAADDSLDDAAKNARHTIAGRSIEASKEAPYTDLFPKGISYYTAAPLDEEEKRYGELKKRLVDHLPATDDVRKKTVKAIDEGLTDFKAATKELDDAHTAESLASTRLSKATDTWVKQMEKTYGALVGEVGRAGAERYFPRVTRKTAAETRAAKAKGEKKPE